MTMAMLRIRALVKKYVPKNFLMIYQSNIFMNTANGKTLHAPLLRGDVFPIPGHPMDSSLLPKQGGRVGLQLTINYFRFGKTHIERFAKPKICLFIFVHNARGAVNAFALLLIEDNLAHTQIVWSNLNVLIFLDVFERLFEREYLRWNQSSLFVT